METNNKPEIRICLFCEKQIEKGARLDKVYCNVNCKNNYNARIKAALQARGTANQKEILRIIKNNYQILLNYKKDDRHLSTDKLSKQELERQGFNPKFFTSIVDEPEKGQWKCCFDIGYLEDSDDHYKLAILPIQEFIDKDTGQKIIAQYASH